MGLILFGLMIAVPILEIAVFIVVGQFIGLWPTLAGILLTALVGTAIIRHQGIGIVAKARRTMAAGEAPVGAVLEGLALVIAGALLITPGFVTDSLGFLLLVPGLRRAVAAVALVRATRRAEVHMQAGTARPGGATGGPGAGGRGSARPSGAGVTIDGEYTDLSDAGADRPEEQQPDPGRSWGRTAGEPEEEEEDPKAPPPIRSADG